MSAFEIRDQGEVTIIKCPADLGTDAATDFFNLTQSWLTSATKLFVLDFVQARNFDRNMMRPILLFHQSLKKEGRFVFAINIPDAIGSVIQSNGLESVLAPKADLEDAMKSAGINGARVISKKAIDVEFANPFIEATKVTLETQANTPVKIGKPRLKTEGEALTFDIAGVISLTSNAFHGSIAICFPAPVFLAIYSAMLGEKHDVITKEIEDAAGEILNIIFGQAKAVLNAKEGYAIQKAIPTIVRGNTLQVHHLTRTVAVVLPFETAAGQFNLEISAERS